MSFAIVATKVREAAFRDRLAVAVTEHCRYTLGLAQGARSAARFAWDNQHARNVLQAVAHEAHLTRFARLVLLPAVWGAFDPDDDDDLIARVGERFEMFAADAPPA